MLAVAMIAVIGLTVAVVVLANNDGATTGTSSAANGLSEPIGTQLRPPSHARDYGGTRCPICASRHRRTAGATTADPKRAAAESRRPPPPRVSGTTAAPTRDRAAAATSRQHPRLAARVRTLISSAP
jgi:hypothetical protein